MARRHGRRLSRAGILASRDRSRRLAAGGAAFSTLADEDADPTHGRRRWSRRRRSAGFRAGWSSARARSAPARSSAIRDPQRCRSSLNLRVKYRESFRPFAPAVLREDVADWFDLDGDSPYMLIVADVRQDTAGPPMTADEKALFGIDKLNVPRSEIPAVTHVDYSARIQTVHADTNPRFHTLLTAFKARDRLPGAGQHQLQRAWRTDRLHAGRCVPLLHGQRDRSARGRQLLPAQGGSGPRR